MRLIFLQKNEFGWGRRRCSLSTQVEYFIKYSTLVLSSWVYLEKYAQLLVLFGINSIFFSNKTSITLGFFSPDARYIYMNPFVKNTWTTIHFYLFRISSKFEYILYVLCKQNQINSKLLWCVAAIILVCSRSLFVSR